MDTGYTFAVMAFNKVGESGYSAEVQGITASENIFNKIFFSMMIMVVVAMRMMMTMVTLMRRITGGYSNILDNVGNVGLLVFPIIFICLRKAFGVLRRREV